MLVSYNDKKKRKIKFQGKKSCHLRWQSLWFYGRRYINVLNSRCYFFIILQYKTTIKQLKLLSKYVNYKGSIALDCHCGLDIWIETSVLHATGRLHLFKFYVIKCIRELKLGQKCAQINRIWLPLNSICVLDIWCRVIGVEKTLDLMF